MTRLKAFGFLLVFLVPATLPAAAWLASGRLPPDVAACFPLVALFVLLPLADYALGHDGTNVPAADERAFAASRWFRGLTVLALPVHLAMLAVNTAHELVHRDSRFEQTVGGLRLHRLGSPPRRSRSSTTSSTTASSADGCRTAATSAPRTCTAGIPTTGCRT